ncbi:isoprenylcysteine carboxylmethyltransferase family protein [candidate division KSB1 bacterium]|nr:isoprenylcysteine carboxylmethyltransferase family protein [candidate division KSB1 bacterium]RQW09283.1 MAG: isoprenylcysteine carboxylmethyltransferase family protein [candidate division KSB1 bacterium]
MATLKIGLWNAWLFMSVFLLQMIAMFALNGRAAKKTHLPIKIKRKKTEKYSEYIANFVWLIAMIYSIFLPLKFASTWFIFGFSLFMIGLIFLILATVDFMTTPVDQVISKGIYRISRHPMYVATFFICTGTGMAAGSWLFILLSFVLAICFYQQALLEERFCLEIYADAYKEYMRTTPRLLGLPRKMNSI